jgi:hypothetical protein
MGEGLVFGLFGKNFGIRSLSKAKCDVKLFMDILSSKIKFTIETYSGKIINVDYLKLF